MAPTNGRAATVTKKEGASRMQCSRDADGSTSDTATAPYQALTVAGHKVAAQKGRGPKMQEQCLLSAGGRPQHITGVNHDSGDRSSGNRV
jgi:hypothetical protein